MSRKLFIAGVTGSIGRQALGILDAAGDLELVGISAGSDLDALLEIAASTGIVNLALAETLEVPAPPGLDLRSGADAAAGLISELRPDVVLNAVVGFAGLSVSVAALEAGCDLALANKESLVAGGDLVMALAEATGASVIPVDSEHASLAQLLVACDPTEIERLWITASGGPFRGSSREQLRDVTVDQALSHPTWRMGGKITIDSATLMNKGLELIEAHHLFGLPYERLAVIVHPQSIVHGLVELHDGVQMAHLGMPDMRVPIAWALAQPAARPRIDHEPLDLISLGRLEFEAPDEGTFPALRLAREAGSSGGTAPVVLNAANEVAVEAFLEGRLAFLAITEVVEDALQAIGTGKIHDFETVRRADGEARLIAGKRIAKMADR